MAVLLRAAHEARRSVQSDPVSSGHCTQDNWFMRSPCIMSDCAPGQVSPCSWAGAAVHDSDDSQTAIAAVIADQMSRMSRGGRRVGGHSR